VLVLQVVFRERTISDRYRIETDTGCIVSNRVDYCCIGRYYVHHCGFINCWRVALHTMTKGRSSAPSPASRTRVRAAGGRGFEGREAEGDCNLIPASPWHKDGAVLVLATIMPHSLHQQEVITSVSCQSL